MRRPKQTQRLLNVDLMVGDGPEDAQLRLDGRFKAVRDSAQPQRRPAAQPARGRKAGSVACSKPVIPSGLINKLLLVRLRRLP